MGGLSTNRLKQAGVFSAVRAIAHQLRDQVSGVAERGVAQPQLLEELNVLDPVGNVDQPDRG